MSRPPKSGVRKPRPAGQTWPVLVNKIVLGDACCCNKNTTAGWLKQQRSLPGLWGLEVRDQGAGLAGFWRGLSPYLHAAILSLRPHTVEGGRKGWPSSFSCKEACLIMELHPHGLITPQKPPPLNIATLGPLYASGLRVWGDTAKVLWEQSHPFSYGFSVIFLCHNSRDEFLQQRL